MDKVEDFSDLKSVSDEKLLKLRDVATSNAARLNQEAADAMSRLRDILNEIEERKNV
ncbi:hypothetical protein pEaSNUABM56_00057 [Erwinia phage pEa_SNUABM_56]|uniref:Uncharacterized protein n=1 Tax=Erwinia phage pEp_SNUABM_01 TaxID=2601643 RepID=A0A5J6DAN0_9CAUD|nr:hypothetical protein HWC63_gp031 [Erwinia phage pEp_SNUABM_01]QEQ94857.1 hypothetical protein pEpSNUABM01_031 [Erwinia phage pEp_SNUABM_01]UYL85035.1 hypothetical protein pEaSNUABM55_00262 [Erwinia phage pEa_SNUABM_55]UYL85102.1 hypothetical protein pEaSNUABM56_00057 [Erwinia phage pEa_SNUABM_56]